MWYFSKSEDTCVKKNNNLAKVLIELLYSIKSKKVQVILFNCSTTKLYSEPLFNNNTQCNLLKVTNLWQGQIERQTNLHSLRTNNNLPI